MSSQAVKRFLPLADRILVQKLKSEVKSAGGILLPEQAQARSNQAKVVAVGPGRLTPKGDLVAMGTKAGDTVVIPMYGGTELKLGNDEEYHIFRDDDILGIMHSE